VTPTIPDPCDYILIVDDEPNLRRTLALILQRAGYQVTMAASGSEAIKFISDNPFDLVFLDLKMPEISGLDLLPEIRRQLPDVPVLILTAHATLDSAIEAVRRGARDYLLKPIDPEKILARVTQVLAEQEHPRRRREIVMGMQNLLAELTKIEGYKEPGNLDEEMTQGIISSRYLQRGQITLDLHTRQATVSGGPVSLSPTAFDYLATLLRHSPEAVSCETLVRESQGYKSMPVESQEMARWRIHELRRAIEPNPDRPVHIITVRGIGYRLVT